MLILEEYYPFQVLQIFAGVAPYAYRSNSNNQFNYSIIAIFSSLFQTGIAFAYTYWILPTATAYLNAIYDISKVTEAEATNESTNLLFRVAISFLNHIIAIVLRVDNIVQASKLPGIFEEINRIDSLLRITNNYSKSSRRRVFGLMLLLLFICWIIHVPFYSIALYGMINDVLFYHFCNFATQFTIATTEWSQVIFLFLLKRRYSFLNKKLNLIYTSVTEGNHSQEAIITTWFHDKKDSDHWDHFPSVGSVPKFIDNSIENGGKKTILNYLNIFKKIFSSESRATSKINKRMAIAVSELSRRGNSKMAEKSTSKRKKIISSQVNPSNILRVSTAQELDILRIAHQELSTVLTRIISFFRFRIFLAFCTVLFSLLDNLHYILQQLIQPWKTGPPLWVLLRHPAFFIAWTLEYFTRIICIVWSNSATKSEAKKALLHLERLQVPLLLRNYQEALEELEYFKRYMYSEVAFSSSGAVIDFHGSLILRVIDISINYVFLILQQTFRKI